MNAPEIRPRSKLLPSELCEHVESGLRELLAEQPELSDGALRRAAVDIGSSAVIAISNQILSLEQAREVLHLYMCSLLEDRVAQIMSNTLASVARSCSRPNPLSES